jgi:hypothetical protein
MYVLCIEGETICGIGNSRLSVLDVDDIVADRTHHEPGCCRDDDTAEHHKGAG